MRLSLLLTTLLGVALASLDVPAGVRITLADRTIDATSQIVKNTIALTFTNDGDKEVNTVYYLVPSKEDAHVAFFSANEDKKDAKLRVSKVPGANAGFQAWKIELLNRIAKGQSLKLSVDYQLTHYLTPYPAAIEQGENQFVQYEGDAHVVSVYPIEKETTWVKLSEGKIQSHSTVAPSKVEGQKVIYGPYNDQKPYTSAPIKVHYENNSPFVVAVHVERLIELSHWGNIAIEESIELVHKGASLKTVLPAAARDVYYRDEIGNISTSALRQRSDRVELELKPRFPLFGGWKTTYTLGYNVPAYEYLYSKGNQYQLKMRFLDHIFDNAVVEKLTVRILLPELSRNVKLVTPYTVTRKPDEVKATYLDTAGRPMIVLEKENLVPAHIQTFTLTYDFEWSNMIREPLIASTFFFALFVAVIIYVRFDFSIVADKARDAREKAQGKLVEISELVLKRFRHHDSIANAVAKFKENRDAGVLQATRKRIEDDRALITAAINDLSAQLKSDGNDVTDKVAELNKIEKGIEEAEAAYLQSVQAQKAGSKKSAEDSVHQEKVHTARTKANNILSTF